MGSIFRKKTGGSAKGASPKEEGELTESYPLIEFRGIRTPLFCGEKKPYLKGGSAEKRKREILRKGLTGEHFSLIPGAREKRAAGRDGLNTERPGLNSDGEKGLLRIRGTPS